MVVLHFSPMKNYHPKMGSLHLAMLTNHTLRTSFFPYGPKPDLNLSYNIAGKNNICFFVYLLGGLLLPLLIGGVLAARGGRRRRRRARVRRRIAHRRSLQGR